jgi:hypothetical protein
LALREDWRNLFVKKPLGNIRCAVNIVFLKNIGKGRLVLLNQALHLLSLSDEGVRTVEYILAGQVN